MRPAPRRLLLAGLLAPLLLGLPACGKKDPAVLSEDGYAALNSGDNAKAAGLFEDALEGMQPSDPQYAKTKFGLVKAIAPTNPERARQEFLDLAKSNPEDIGDREFVAMARMIAKTDMSQAIQLAKDGKERFAESAELQKLVKDLGKQAEAGGNGADLDALKGLGYVGGDTEDQ